KKKIGIIKKLDTKAGEGVHTFLDDLVASIAACAASRIAHKARDLEEEEATFDDVPSFVMSTSAAESSNKAK
ncbi:hypothetical protein RhiirA1_483215, partial [Rhizophagus irregularis]